MRVRRFGSSGGRQSREETERGRDGADDRPEANHIGRRRRRRPTGFVHSERERRDTGQSARRP